MENSKFFPKQMTLMMSWEDQSMITTQVLMKMHSRLMRIHSEINLMKVVNIKQLLPSY